MTNIASIIENALLQNYKAGEGRLLIRHTFTNNTGSEQEHLYWRKKGQKDKEILIQENYE